MWFEQAIVLFYRPESSLVSSNTLTWFTVYTSITWIREKALRKSENMIIVLQIYGAQGKNDQAVEI